MIKLENLIITRELLEKCYEKNVIFTPGDIFTIDNTCKNALRLGLSRLTLKEIESGIKIIGECIENTPGV